jgi:phospholipid/cholesterol/gamma-HCH transport system substrate-binding protein
LKEEVKAGTIIVVSLVILSAFIILIGGGRLFDDYDKYQVHVMNAGGLEVGAQVRLGGVRIGRILSIKPPAGPGKPVTIEVGIEKGTILYKGTRAMITQLGFVGDIYLLLTVQETTNEKIKVGDVIPSKEQVQFDVLMAKLEGISDSVDKLIKDINKIFSQKNIDGIELLVENTNNAVVSGSASIDQVASSLKSTTDKLKIVLDEIENILKDNKEEFAQLLQKAREDIEKAGDMIESIESTAKSIEKTSDTADEAIALQSQNLDNFLNTLNRTTEELQELLQEIKHKPWSIIRQEKKGD